MKFDFNLKARKGRTPLQYSIKKSFIDAFLHIISLGDEIDLILRDENGKTSK